MLDKTQIYKWWHIFKNDKELVEVRILGKKTYSGYYKNVDKLIQDISVFDDVDEYQIYFTLNKIKDECYGRQQCERLIVYPKHTTTDNDIDGRTFVLIDLDPKRATGVNSSDEELEFAHKKAIDVYKFLKENGFNEPIVAMSGNGYHILLPCKMKISEDNNNIIKRFLLALDMLFSDDKIEIDKKVFNPARICKLYGTTAKKGSNIEGREWRISKIIKHPAETKENHIEYFKKVAQMYPEDDVKPTIYNNFSTEKFNVEEFLNKHGIKYTKQIINEGTKYILEHCAFDESHKGKDAMVFQRNNGALAYVCLHNSCSQYKWSDFRLKYEPNAYELKTQYIERRKAVDVKEVKVPKSIEKTAQKGEIWLKMSQIKKPQFDITEYIPSGIKQIDDLMIGFKRKQVSVWSGYRACVDCDTEYFNGKEWVKISEYKSGDKVLQYNLDGTASLVFPSAYHKVKCDKLTHFYNETNTINQCVCDEHNIVYNTKSGKTRKKKFVELKNKLTEKHRFNGYIIPTFDYSGKGIEWNDYEIRLGIAVSAEGHIYEKRPNKNHSVRINVKHKYKIDDILFLLEKLGIEYRIKHYNKTDYEMVTILFCWEKSFKVFPKEWYNMNKHQMQVVYDNVVIYDGYRKENEGVYRTIQKQNADFIQFVSTSLGHKAAIGKDERKENTCYIVSFSKKHKNGITMNSNKKDGTSSIYLEEYKTKDGYKYCFTVDSGMLVLRRGDAINVTGNCGKSSLLNMLILNAANLGYKSALWTGELDCDEVKRWLYLQASGKQYNKPTQYPNFYYTPDVVCSKIDTWIDDYFLLFNSNYGNNFSQIVEEVRKLKKEQDLDVVFLDNLMTLGIENLDGDKNDRQKNMMIILHDLAQELNIHIHIVAHPNKSGNFLRPNNISGTGHIPDLAQNVFILHRVNQDFEKNAMEFLSAETMRTILECHCTNTMEICKCRDKGTAVDNFINLFFEVESNRLKNDIAENIIYRCFDEYKPVSQNIEYETRNISPNENYEINEFENSVELPY